MTPPHPHPQFEGEGWVGGKRNYCVCISNRGLWIGDCRLKKSEID